MEPNAFTVSEKVSMKMPQKQDQALSETQVSKSGDSEDIPILQDNLEPRDGTIKISWQPL